MNDGFLHLTNCFFPISFLPQLVRIHRSRFEIFRICFDRKRQLTLCVFHFILFDRLNRLLNVLPTRNRFCGRNSRTVPHATAAARR